MNLMSLRNKLIPCSVMLLAVFHMDLTYAAADKQAEQIASMYLSAMVNGNVAEAQKLNELFRPEFEGKDAIDINIMKEFSDSMVTGATEEFMPSVPDDKKDEFRPAVMDLSRSFVAAFLRSKCTVQGSNVKRNDVLRGNHKIATIRYTCLIPDVENKVRALLKNYGEQPPTTAFFAEIASIYQNAPLTKSVKGTADLYSMEKKGVWFTGSPNEMSRPVLWALANPLTDGLK